MRSAVVLLLAALLLPATLLATGCGGPGERPDGPRDTGGPDPSDGRSDGRSEAGTDTTDGVSPDGDLGPGPCEGVECDAPVPDCLAPPPAGAGGSSRAGQVTPENRDQELLAGPAAQGRPGDYFMGNDRIRVILQGPQRVMGPAPYGGNIIDADFAGGPTYDQFGELTLLLSLGRTVNFTRGRVICDGKAGGPAVVQFIGHDALIDFINLPGLLPASLLVNAPDPNLSLGLEVAATYVLWPGETTLEVAWTFRNTGTTRVRTPLGILGDTGGEAATFAPTAGYRQTSLGVELLTTSTTAEHVTFTAPGPTPASPGIAHGIWPRFEAGVEHVHLTVSGVLLMVFKAGQLLDVLNRAGQALEVQPGEAVTQQLDFIVARDPAGVLAEVLARRGDPASPVTGTVTRDGQPVNGARVAVLADDAEGTVRTVFETQPDGRFSGALPPGSYQLIADLEGHLRSSTLPLQVTAGTEPGPLALQIAPAASLEYAVVDDVTGQPIPAKVSVIGSDPSPLDNRFRSTRERPNRGLSRIIYSAAGSSAIDGPIPIEPNPGQERYRVVISRGPEYTVHSELLTPLAAGESRLISARLRRVIDTSGYVAADFHQHSLNSPDSPVPLRDRVISYLVEGAEFVATSDHEYITDLSSEVAALDAQSLISTVPGMEITTFDYGHFNVYPLVPDPEAPGNGTIDWGNDEKLFNLAPADIFALYVEQKGVKVRQVNHPRSVPAAGLAGPVATALSAWDRAGLIFDFPGRFFGGTPESQPVPNEVLRLDPDRSVFTTDMDAFEVYNGFDVADSDGDGVREEIRVDRILRDYLNFLAFGAVYTPVGTSDTHVRGNGPASYARTMVRVPADTPAAIQGGLGDAVSATINGTSDTPRDVVVTNGPMVRLDVSAAGTSCTPPDPATDLCQGESCTRQGGTVALGGAAGIPAGQPAFVRYQITAESPGWAPIDVVELLATTSYDRLATPDELEGAQPDTALSPTVCFVAPGTPVVPAKCQLALSAQGLAVSDTGGVRRMVASGCLDLRTLPRRTGAVGDDGYLVARAYGTTATMFPVIPGDVAGSVEPTLLIDPATVPAGVGVFPLGFTSAVLVDVDGGGWRGPFQP